MKKFKQWYSGLTGLGKASVVSAGLVLGTAYTLGAVVEPTPTPTPPTNTVSAEPKITTKTAKVEEVVVFKTKTVSDPFADKGTTSVTTEGVNGIRTKTYKVTLTDGAETDRQLISNKITKQPVTKVVSKGTYVAPKPKPKPASPANCDPNYSGACVPIASDVDCGGGSGNGPAYVYSTVTVIGSDIYGLDADSDGYGCE